MPRGKEIDKKILEFLKKSKNPVSTRDIALQIGVSWHPVRFHCFQLQTEGRIESFHVGNMNLWVIKK